MGTHTDILIGRIALERGFITSEQLADCLKEQTTLPAGNGSLLGSILLKRGFVRPDQLETLLEEQKRRLSDALDISDPKLEDALLGRLLIKQGLATERQVYECLRVQAELAERGEPGLRLGELLVHKRYISTDAVDTALLLQKKEIFVCPSCGVLYSTLGADPAKKYVCKKCNCVLDRQERLYQPGETTGAVRIDMPDDAAAVAKDPERKFSGGKYILIQEVGRGGMGVVWKAWQSDLKRYVAIKILAGSLWTESELKRFYREAQLAAGLSHSNVASIYDVGTHEGKHYIAMEFVDGDPLSHVLAAHSSAKHGGTARAVKHVPLRRGVEIVRDAAIAVDYAHSKGLIHRDVKPGNIMTTRQGGRVYVMDFGLAKPVRGKEITVSDAIMGTPSYMSPEQARGEALDRRADVYSLGAVLYYVLTGQPPFTGQSPTETLMHVVADDPVPPRRINPRVHADLETICLKTLDKDRHRRYDSARSFADDLSRYLDGEPISARPMSARERLWKAARARPVRSVLVAAATAAALLFALVILILNWRTSAKVSEFLAQGDLLFASEKYDQALSEYEKVLAVDENHKHALERKHQCAQIKAARDDRARKQIAATVDTADRLFDAGAFDKALEQYNQVLALKPDHEHALACRKKCEKELAREKSERLEKEKRNKEAAQATDVQLALDKLRLEKRVKAMPFYEAARSALDAAARIKLRAGFPFSDILVKYAEAREALTRAVREDDSYVEAWFLRGLVRHKMGDYELAEKDYQTALKVNPSFAPAAFNMALSHIVMYELHSHIPYFHSDEALTALTNLQKSSEQAQSLSQNTFERWCSMALNQFFARRYTDAIDSLEKVRVEGSGQVALNLVRACIYIEDQRKDDALTELTTALDLEPAAFEALFLRSWLRIIKDDLAGALEDAQKAVEAAPENPLSYLIRANAYDVIGKKDLGLRDLQKAASLGGALAEEIQKVVDRRKD